MRTNVIHCGDCLNIMQEFDDEVIDLIYLDPPFFSNKKYEVLWHDGYEIRAFEDRWKGGIEHYISWMQPRLEQCNRVLKKKGSIYLHCDWHANAHLRILMDMIFQSKNFKNEIIWHYTGGGRSEKYFSRKHDTILLYGKDDTMVFNIDAIRTPYKETSGYAKGGIISKAGKKYMPNPNGTPMDDVWDIPIINPLSKERLGYPTQKPEMLLERIIKASSNIEDIILDPFCGCGTTIAVAQKLHRAWIGIDVSPTACRLMVERLRKISPISYATEIIGLPRTRDEWREMNPHDFQSTICMELGARVSDKKSNDMGIDGMLFDGTLIQIKKSERVGRNVVDNFETALRRYKKDKGMIVAFSFGKGAIEEVARAKHQDGIEIELKTVNELRGINKKIVEPIYAN